MESLTIGKLKGIISEMETEFGYSEDTIIHFKDNNGSLKQASDILVGKDAKVFVG